MEAESFFARWAKRNAEAAEEKRAEAEQQPVEQLPPPTLEDVAQLTPESDFKRFVASGIDEDVRRSAMKKLFSDPHFNVMDGLDVYIEDYNSFEPIPEAMLAMLNHAKGLLNPLAQVENPLMQLLQTEVEKDEAPAEEQSEQADASHAPKDAADVPTVVPTDEMPAEDTQADVPQADDAQ